MNTDLDHYNENRAQDDKSVGFSGGLPTQIRHFMHKHMSFLICVAVPTFLVFIYLTLMATPQYISEAHFVVRGRSSQSGLSLGSILQTGGSAPTSENTYVVQDYIQSRDAAELLITKNNLLDIYARPEADFFSRYPFLLLPKNFENFYLHFYKSHILVEQDAETNISSLTVRTFRAEDSQHIARALLDAGENLVNDINRRQRENLIRATSLEVKAAETKLRELNQKLADYRNAIALIDPLRQSVPMTGFITSLQNMLASTNMQLSQLQKSAPSSPLVAAYQRQADILSEQIKKSGSQITGADYSLVPKITGYEDLMVQRDIQQRILVSDVASLEAAKQQANQQMIYIDVVAQPNAADWPEYPRNLLVLIITFLSTLGLYVMGSLLIAGARERNLQ